MKPEFGRSSKRRVSQTLSQRNITWPRQTETERWVRREGISLVLDECEYQLNLCVGTCVCMHSVHVCVCVYTEGTNRWVINTFWNLSNKDNGCLWSNFKLQTNIPYKPSYLGPNDPDDHKWERGAPPCCRPWSLEPEPTREVKPSQQIWCCCTFLVLIADILISMFASKWQPFKAFEKWQVPVHVLSCQRQESTWTHLSS